jgi:hypothetical protein
VSAKAPAESAPAIEVPVGVSIANHPRARAWIRRTRARMALAAFGLVALVALNAGVPAQDAVLRALLAGVGAFLCAWAIGVMLWKQIVMSELRTVYERRQARRRRVVEAAAERDRVRREAAAAKAAARA